MEPYTIKNHGQSSSSNIGASDMLSDEMNMPENLGSSSTANIRSSRLDQWLAEERDPVARNRFNIVNPSSGHGQRQVRYFGRTETIYTDSSGSLAAISLQARSTSSSFFGRTWITNNEEIQSALFEESPKPESREVRRQSFVLIGTQFPQPFVSRAIDTHSKSQMNSIQDKVLFGQDHESLVTRILEVVPIEAIALQLVLSWRQKQHISEDNRVDHDSINRGQAAYATQSYSESPNFEATQQTSVPSGASNSPGPSSRTSENVRKAGRSSIGREKGAKRHFGNGDQPSEDGYDEPPKRPRNNCPDTDPEPSASYKKRLFRCPYHAKDPWRYSEHNRQEPRYRNCSGCTLANIPCVKQHLERKHQRPPHYCARCFDTFKTRAEVDWHGRTFTCTVKDQSECPFVERMTEDQAADIYRRRRGGTDEAKWYYIYRVLFPDGPLPPSPCEYPLAYSDLSDRDPDVSEDGDFVPPSFLDDLQHQVPLLVQRNLDFMQIYGLQAQSITEPLVLEAALSEFAAQYSRPALLDHALHHESVIAPNAIYVADTHPQPSLRRIAPSISITPPTPGRSSQPDQVADDHRLREQVPLDESAAVEHVDFTDHVAQRRTMQASTSIAANSSPDTRGYNFPIQEEPFLALPDFQLSSIGDFHGPHLSLPDPVVGSFGDTFFEPLVHPIINQIAKPLQHMRQLQDVLETDFDYPALLWEIDDSAPTMAKAPEGMSPDRARLIVESPKAAT